METNSNDFTKTQTIHHHELPKGHIRLKFQNDIDHITTTSSKRFSHHLRHPTPFIHGEERQTNNYRE